MLDSHILSKYLSIIDDQDRSFHLSHVEYAECVRAMYASLSPLFERLFREFALIVLSGSSNKN